MYDRVGKALVAANLSNYLYRFRENEMDDELVEFCIHDPVMAEELNRIMPVRIHQLNFKKEFLKTGSRKYADSFDTLGSHDSNSKSSQKSSNSTEEDLKVALASELGAAAAEVGLISSLRSQLEKVFQDVDADKSGRISVEELYSATRKNNDSKLSFDACRLMITMFAADRKALDFNGFFNLILQGNEWQAVFNKFDRDNSGFLDRKELIGPLQDMAKGYLFDQQFVDMIIEKFGIENKEGLDNNGFINACAFISTFTQGFRDKDKGREGVVNYQDFLSIVLDTWN